MGYILFGVFLIVIAIWLSKYLKERDREKWTIKIRNSLSGELGKKLKECIYSNSEIYRVYEHAVLYYDGSGNERVVNFSRFGYEKVPVVHTDIICDWIAKHIVQEKGAYIIEPMVHEFELYEKGTPGAVQIRGSFGRYKVERLPGQSGRWVDHKSLMGYMLYHRSQRDYYSNEPKKLKKW